MTPWTVAWRLLYPGHFPGKNIGVGCHFLLQGIFPTRKSNMCLPRFPFMIEHTINSQNLVGSLPFFLLPQILHTDWPLHCLCPIFEQPLGPRSWARSEPLCSVGVRALCLYSSRGSLLIIRVLCSWFVSDARPWLSWKQTALFYVTMYFDFLHISV